MDISKTLFVVDPEDKFLCSFHGGLMDTPFQNSTCYHNFCSFCIETLTNCPIDNCIISSISINDQLKDEFDQLLCYCKFGIETNESNGEITTKVNGCDCLISYGSKAAHELVCRFNTENNNERSPSSLSYQDFFEMKSSSGSSASFSSPSQYNSSNHTSPKSNTSSTSKSPSMEQISLHTKQQTNIHQPIQEEEYFDNNQLWESSTSLFFHNIYCPNKEFGCCYNGKSEQDLMYHLEVECYCQKMKEKIIHLESKVEEKEEEIKILRSSISSSKLVGKTTPTSTSSLSSSLSSSSSSPLSLSLPIPPQTKPITNNNNCSDNYINFDKPNNKQIQNITIGKIIIVFFEVIKKGIKKSFKKVKKIFTKKNSSGPYKNFIKIN